LRLGDEGPRVKTVRVFGYAMPSCGDACLCRFCERFVTSIINCDDIVPRLSLETVRQLREELDHRKEEFKEFAMQDFEVLKDVKSLVELKRRGKDPGSSPASEPPPPSPMSALELADKEIQPFSVAELSSKTDTDPNLASRVAKFLDLFLFCRGPGIGQSEVHEELVFPAQFQEDGPDDDETSEEEVVNKDEVRLHPLGRLVHLYRSCGVRRAAWIDRKHPALQRIEVALGLVQDHSGEAYKAALEEAMAVAEGAEPPRWRPFAETSHCGCCGEAFGWDSVLRSEPHRLQARHHCHSCGTVVCSSCSQRRRPLPQFGIFAEVRVCDRCFLRPVRAAAPRA